MRSQRPVVPPVLMSEMSESKDLMNLESVLKLAVKVETLSLYGTL